MPRPGRLAILALAVLTGACATGPRQGPVEVTRYHLGAPLSRGTFVVEPVTGAMTVSTEYRAYADAVARAMQPLGFTPAASGATSDFIAGVSFTRAERGAVQRRSPVSIGIGGGTGGYGGGVGVGGGVGLGLGGGASPVIASELGVQLRRRSDGTTVWEGRAQTRSVGFDAAQEAAQADRLANALFQNFPGESGITMTVE